MQIEGHWTARDIVAHLSFWEASMAGWLAEAAAGQKPDRPTQGFSDELIQSMNEENHTQTAHLSIHEVLAEAATNHSALVERLNALPDDPADPQYAVWRNGEPPWELIAGCSYEHYHEHLQRIESYLTLRGNTATTA